MSSLETQRKITMNELEHVAFSTYNQATGKVLDGNVVSKLLGSVLSFRYFSDEVYNEPAPALRDLFASSVSNKVVFPCDPIELRFILGNETISIGHEVVPLFAWSFANKYLKKYSVFLLIDGSKILVDSKKYGGVAIFEAPSLGIENALLRVVVNEPTSNGVVNTVRNIVLQTNKNIEFSVSNSVPGTSFSSAKIPLVKTAQNVKIELTPQEKALFNKIKNLRDRAGLAGKVEVRVAGGWVRDKLLGKNSKDVDFCLTNMTGVQFCEATGLPMDAIIKAKPDKSKQLEPVKTMIDGQEVDFVNCRTEKYAPGSRIPIQAIGTPQEDAERRDFTINSIFFNIETEQVEDYVGGKADLLENKVLKANRSPMITFMEDPLRVLRACRFKSRFPFLSVDGEIIEAMKNPQIQEAYKKAVSMERAGPEIMGMMGGDDPTDAVRMLFETGFYKVAFNTPIVQQTLGIDMDQRNEHHKLSLMNHTLEVIRNLNKLVKEDSQKRAEERKQAAANLSPEEMKQWEEQEKKEIAQDKKMAALMNMSAMFHDFGKMHPEGQQDHPNKPGQRQYLTHEDWSAKMSEEVLKSIGIGDKDRNVVNKVVQMHMTPHGDVEKWREGTIGDWYKKTHIPGQEDLQKSLWKYVMFHAMADSMSKGDDTWHEDVASKQRGYDKINNYLNAPPPMKPLVDGRRIMELIPELKPDSGFINDINKMLMEMQYSRQITTPEQAQQKVLEWKQQNLQAYLNKGPVRKAVPQQKNKVQQPIQPPQAPPSEGQRQAMNWWSKVKLADKDIYKDTPLEGRDDEIVHMEYKGDRKPKASGPAIEKLPNGEVKKNPVVQLGFRVGDKVRDRRVGIALKQRFGKIIDIKPDEHGNDCYHVRWDNDEIQKIRLNDTANIAALLARA